MRPVRDRRPFWLAAALLATSILPLAIAGCDSGASNGSAVPVSGEALNKRDQMLKNIRQQNYDAHKKGVPPGR